MCESRESHTATRPAGRPRSWCWLPGCGCLAEEAGPPLGAVAACAMFVMHGALRKLWEQELHAL
eukprot:COSAG01_NODE_18314_length_1085_cov_1.140974_1_plen_63_part_10